LGDCNTTRTIRQNACFPRGLTEKDGKDYSQQNISASDQLDIYPEEENGINTLHNSSSERVYEDLNSAEFRVVDSNNMIFHAQQYVTVVSNYTDRFTIAQIQKINKLNNIYNFNAKTYLSKYETAEVFYHGPQRWDGKATVGMFFVSFYIF
jgi:hypothetical protein